jgi:hypothetical protein
MSLANTIWTTKQQGDPSQGFQFDYQFVRWEEVRTMFVTESGSHPFFSWYILCNGLSTPILVVSE